MAYQEQYIGGPTGGIPERIFTSEFDGVVKGKSGAELACKVSKNLIAVLSKDSFRFIATRNVAHPEMVLFNIKSKIGDPQHPVRHPDIYATELAKRAVAYFDEEGPEVIKLKGTWVGRSSDNYTSYRTHLDKIAKERPTTREDKKNAAISTWTGDLAQKLGFTKIENIRDHGETITVLFIKPHLNQK